MSSSTNILFITGTDTDAGKTFSSCVLVHNLKQLGKKVVPYKPIVAGFENGKNYDLESHLRASNCGLTVNDITSYTYDEPIAPHIAAKKHNEIISFEKLDEGLNKLLKLSPDYVVVEGAGGWLLPLGYGRTLADWPTLNQKMGVIMVVGMKLGCLNHALLTERDIKNRGGKLLGFIANNPYPEKMPFYDENLATLKEVLSCPCLGEIPYEPSGDFKNCKIDLEFEYLFF